MTRIPRSTLLLLLACMALASPAAAQTSEHEFILRAPADQIPLLASAYGLQVLGQVAADHPGVVRVLAPESAPPEVTAELMVQDEAVESLEPVQIASLFETSDALQVDQSTTTILEAITSVGIFADPDFTAHFGAALWNGYANQPAVQLLRVHEAHASQPAASGYGSGIVAVIDTGVDPGHPFLQGALVPGFDFILEQPGDASEWSGLDQSTTTILEQSTTTILEQSTTTILEGNATVFAVNQSTTTILEQSTTTILEGLEIPPAFGHGTMVAGVIRLVAPAAKIMPLRAFDAQGNASLFDIIRAIHFAVENGAQVINMSFSTEDFSAELARAVNWAHRHGVVCVSASGNKGERVVTYPAAFGNSVGVASTDLNDGLSSFSNYGSDVAAMAAPGAGVITLWPGGLYAAAWGTSFSAPFVSGSIALLHDTAGNGSLQTATDFYQALYALSKGALYLPQLAAELGNGRLDVAAAVANRLHIVN